MSSSTAIHARAVLVALAALMLPVVYGACAEDIVLANQVVARIVAAGEYGSVAQRAAKIDQQVTQAISVENVGAPKMSVRSGGAPAIYIGNTFLMKVYPEDAHHYGCSTSGLAQQWSANFAKFFPLAEPCIHMNSKSAGSELGRAQAAAAAAANVTVAPQDWAIVAVTLDHLAQARAMTEPVFQQEMPGLTQAIFTDIKQQAANAHSGKALPAPPHSPGTCPQAGGCPACKAAETVAVAAPDAAAGALAAEPAGVPLAAQRRIQGGLRLARSVDAPRFQRDRLLIAVTIVKAVRKELAGK